MATVLVWWLDAADLEVSISAVVPGGSSSGETNMVEKCEAQLVDSLSKGLQVGDCWDVKTCEETRYKLNLLTWYCQVPDLGFNLYRDAQALDTQDGE